MNVLVLGGRVVGVELARELVSAFLNARFAGEERHLRRLAKMATVEIRCGRSSCSGNRSGSTTPAV